MIPGRINFLQLGRYELPTPTLQKPTGKKGRPKLYDGRIDMSNPDKSGVEKIDIGNGELYTLIAWSKSLKQKVRLAIWYDREGKSPKLFFSANTA